jgi:hypothetical protein
LSRGVFRQADAPLASYPDFLAVARRVPRAIVCLVSAAAVHDLADEIPAAVQSGAAGQDVHAEVAAHLGPLVVLPARSVFCCAKLRQRSR